MYLGYAKEFPMQQEAQNTITNFPIERKIATEIIQHVQRLNLPFKLDELTEGQGNCFPISIIQQCRRPDILEKLSPEAQIIAEYENGHSLLRDTVKKFITQSNHSTIIAFKNEYDQNIAVAMGETWSEYWARMIVDKTEVDYMFIQGTAWYLALDIMIIDTSSTKENPTMIVSGNIENEEWASKDMITIGSKTNSHFQSLLLIDLDEDEMIPNNEKINEGTSKQTEEHSSHGIGTKKEPREMQSPRNSKEGESSKSRPKECRKSHDDQRSQCVSGVNNSKADSSQSHDEMKPFTYEMRGKKIEFKCMTENYSMKCPNCQIETRYIVQHMSKKASCQKQIDTGDFKRKFQEYKNQNKEKILRDQRERQKAARERQRAKDGEKVKMHRRNEEAARRAKLRVEDEEKSGCKVEMKRLLQELSYEPTMRKKPGYKVEMKRLLPELNYELKMRKKS